MRRAFGAADEPCDVRISGVSPSRAFGDATLLFVTNGASYKRLDCTVLGVGIDSPKGTAPLSEYNRLSTSLGYPVEVSTELGGARPLVLRTDVLLDGGIVRVALEGATGGMEVWLPAWYDNHGDQHAPERLLDAATRTERFIPMRRWRNLMARYGLERSLEVRILSPTEGSATLAFEYRASEDGFYVDDHARQRTTAIGPVLLVDYDRDGEIGDGDALRHAVGRAAYFWRNDDRWRGDDAFEANVSANSFNTTVDGRNDLINFLPIAVDVATLASHWGTDSVRYRMEADDWSLRKAQLTLADIGWSDIGDTPLGESSDIDGTAIHEAPVFALGEGADLPPAFVSLAQSRRSSLLMEFPEKVRDASLRLNAYSMGTDVLLFSARLPLHVGDVAQMIGWENLRAAAGGSAGRATDHATPDWPDSEHGEGTVVFVHGYNMEEEDEAPLWAENVFKKLWWSGLDRGFVAVQWRGNEGQTHVQIPFVGYVTPNYYANVRNAFATASALKAAMDGIRGPKWFVAHSLGNMLVSAAIQDYGMPHERYFMLNAAVPMEAYDAEDGITQESHDNMTPELWTGYADRIRATHWFELFPEGDGRRLLTWKDRFVSVANVVNFYSTQEDVVCNGNGTLIPYGRHYAWYNQEYRKGSWGMMLHEYEGGWEFNPYYDTVTMQWNGSEFVEERRRMSPQNAANLGDDQLRLHPFFLDFANSEMHTSLNGQIVATSYLYRAEMLAYAIPAESYAVGANPLPNLSSEELNIDMAGFTDGQADLPENGKKVEEHYRDWQHSTFVQRSYKRTRQLFRRIMEIIKENSHE